MKNSYKNIVFTGPESCGKTTWSTWCASHFGGSWVREFAREYLQNKTSYNQVDLLHIANLQQELISQDQSIPKWCDTDLLTIKIWSEVRFGSCQKRIVTTLKQNLPDLYILCAPDIPWEKDPIREAEHSREELYLLYYNEIVNSNVNFFVLEGNWKERESIIKDFFT